MGSIFLSAAVPGRLSVIIPHWNGKIHLETCLSSLARQTYADLEVIIADNASTDGSQEYIRDCFPQFRIEQLSENRGFTGACNAGMRASTGEFIALLNNDTEVDANWAQEIVISFRQHPEAGFVASRMMLFDRRDFFHTAGDFFRLDGQAGNRGVWEKDCGQFDRAEYVFSACGGASVYRRRLLEEVGLLDDDFFFSHEDLDLGWRAQMLGYKCLYVPRAVVYHKLSASGGGVTSSYYDGRNSLYLLWKNYPTALWWRYAKAIWRNQWRQGWAALRAWRGEAARARLRGMVAGVLTARRMLKKRARIQYSRRVSIEYLQAILTPVDGKYPRFYVVADLRGENGDT